MTEGRGNYAIACTPKGGIFMDGMMFRLAVHRFWYLQTDGLMEAWLVASPFPICEAGFCKFSGPPRLIS